MSVSVRDLSAIGSPGLAAGAPLRSALRRVERRRVWRALFLVMPLLVFLLLNFFLPIGVMLRRSVQDPELPAAMPGTAALIRQWDGHTLPDQRLAQTFAEELGRARERGTLTTVANRLNYDRNGFRTLLFRTARQLPLTEDTPPLDQLVQIDPQWADRATWTVIKHAAGPLTSFYLLAALDRRMNPDGHIQRTPADQAIFVDVFIRTFWISVVVTVLCLALGYPVSYLLVTVPERISNLLMIVVLLPFWTSVLVRTTAWVVLLQRQGIVNDALRWLGLISEPLQLIFNRTGVLIGMTYVLLPFMVLPVYGVMKGISPVTMRVALSLGARPAVAFWRIYVPQTLPGISAGCLLVFILAIGFYVTPALMGGAGDQMISYFIAFYTNQTLNWGMAAALGVLLLTATLLLYLLYSRVAGSGGVRWG